MYGNFQKQVRETPLADGQIAMYYLGQEGFLFHSKTCNVLIDPYLTDAIDRRHTPRDPDWTRRYPAPVRGEELGFVDYVFCSHNHADHTDPLTLSAIAEAGSHTKFFASRAFSDSFQSFGIAADRIVPLDAGCEIRLPGLTVLPIPAAHEELHLTERGYAELSFRMEMEGLTVFHGGDCCLYDGLPEAIGNADVMLLPVNGRDYFRRKNNIIGNLYPREAAMLAEACRADFLIPLHYDLYPGNALPETEIVSAFAPFSIKYHLFRPGERMIYAGPDRI